MMKKRKIMVTFAFAVVSLTAFAQTDEVQRPTPTLLRQEAETARQDTMKRATEERQAQLEKNRAEQATMRADLEAKRKEKANAIKMERSYAVEERKTMRADGVENRAEMANEVTARREEMETEREATRQEMEGRREDIKQQMETRREEAKQIFEQKREEMKQEMEARRESFKQRIDAKREEMKTRVEAQREELKRKLATIKDERKKQTVENLDLKFAEVNTRQLNSLSKTTDRIEGVLRNIISRVEKVEVNGGDTSAIRTAISATESALASARDAIVAQTAKTYPIDVTSEDELKNAVSSVRQSLQADLKAVRDLVKAAHESLRMTADTLKTIPRVDAPITGTPDTDSDTESTDAMAN